MEPNEDFDAARRFIVRRIEEQAAQSGTPLSEEQRLLLRNLPAYPASFPRTTYVVLVPRNLNLERLCAVAKQAYSNDRAVGPLSRDWDFALAVFKLDRHPMAGLLLQAGMKDRRPWWDRFLLVAAALLVIAGAMVPTLLIGIRESHSYDWVAGSVGFVATLSAVYFGYRRIEKNQLHQEVERCRNQSRSMNRVAD